MKRFARGIYKKLDVTAGHYEFEGFPENDDKRHTFFVPISIRTIIMVV